MVDFNEEFSEDKDRITKLELFDCWASLLLKVQVLIFSCQALLCRFLSASPADGKLASSTRQEVWDTARSAV